MKIERPGIRIERVGKRSVREFDPEDLELAHIEHIQAGLVLGWSKKDTLAPSDQIEAPFVAQAINAKKVQPYYVDTLAVHPDVNIIFKFNLEFNVSKSEGALPVTAPSVASEKPKEQSNSLVQAIYNVTSWLWGLIYPEAPAQPQDTQQVMQDNVAQTQQVQQTSDKFDREDMRKFVADMKQIVQRIKEVNEEGTEQINMDDLLLDILRSHVRDKEDRASDHKGKITRDYEAKKKATNDRLAKLDEIVKNSQTSRLWGVFDKIASSAGLIVTAAGAISGGSVLAVVVGLGLVADQIFNDTAKGKIAKLIAWGDTKSEEKWLERLRLGLGVVSMALAFNMGSGGQVFNTAVSVAKGTATLVKGTVDYQGNLEKADLTALENTTKKSDETLKKSMDELKRIVDDVYKHYHNMNEVRRNQNEAFLMVARGNM